MSDTATSRLIQTSCEIATLHPLAADSAREDKEQDFSISSLGLIMGICKQWWTHAHQIEVAIKAELSILQAVDDANAGVFEVEGNLG